MFSSFYPSSCLPPVNGQLSPRGHFSETGMSTPMSVQKTALASPLSRNQARLRFSPPLCTRSDRQPATICTSLEAVLACVLPPLSPSTSRCGHRRDYIGPTLSYLSDKPQNLAEMYQVPPSSSPPLDLSVRKKVLDAADSFHEPHT